MSPYYNVKLLQCEINTLLRKNCYEQANLPIRTKAYFKNTVWRSENRIKNPKPIPKT